MTAADPVYYDPYHRDIVRNPYPTYKRLREEAPLYYNAEYDIFALSRYVDVRACLKDNQTFSSARGGILEIIKVNVEFPAGTFIFNDPPEHTIYRSIVQRIFTPRRMNGMEDKVRKITCEAFDQFQGRDEFDFIADLGMQVPMRVIGTLLGIPEEDFRSVQKSVDDRLRTEEGQALDYSEGFKFDESFMTYIDWRMKNPAEDIITELLNVEFTDAKGENRKLSSEELLTFINVLAGAGNETTNKLIGWTGKTLAEHPEQRRDLVNNPSLIPQTIEEVLRYEPVGPHIARYVTKDVEFYGQTVPAGSSILLLVGAANRDESAFEDPEKFNIHRDRKNAHCTFGYGIHTCIGNVLARMEGKVVLEELLKRYSDWDVDMANAKLLSTSTVRGWETMPAYLNAAGKKTIQQRVDAAAAAENAANDAAPASVEGSWSLSVKSPAGNMDTILTMKTEGGVLKGTQTGDGSTTELDLIQYDPSTGAIEWGSQIKKPMKLKITFTGKVAGNSMSGKVKAGFMGSFPFSGQKS